MPPTPDQVTLQALMHPLRISILARMNAPKARLSPKDIADEFDEHLSNVAYHFKALESAGLIREVDQVQIRGAVKHIYEPAQPALAWTDQVASLSPVARRTLVATTLGNAIEAVGMAVDSGTYERPGCHFSWDTSWTDALGWRLLSQLFEETTKAAMGILRESEERIEAARETGLPVDAFLSSYVISSFESPPRPTADGDQS